MHSVQMQGAAADNFAVVLDDYKVANVFANFNQ